MEMRRLDGNAAAGTLGELFAFDVTTAQALCAGCGTMDLIGADTAYTDAPGLVVRCVHCESVLLRVVHGGGRYWLDLQGVRCLQISEWQ